MLTQAEIDQRVFDLYDEYCHGDIDRREFLQRASVLTVGGVSALAMAESLLPRYAAAQTISFTDQRIKAKYVSYPSPGGTSGTMRGYLVQPSGAGPFPAVLVIHENRGLNPYIEDVARRAATEGFLALAPDGLAPVGGYPGNDDDGRELQATAKAFSLMELLNGLGIPELTKPELTGDWEFKLHQIQRRQKSRDEFMSEIADMSAKSNTELAKAITSLANATESNCTQMDRHDKRAEQIGIVVDRIDGTTRQTLEAVGKVADVVMRQRP